MIDSFHVQQKLHVYPQQHSLPVPGLHCIDYWLQHLLALVLLESHDFQPNFPDKHGNSSLFYATWFGYGGIVRLVPQ